MVEKKERGGAMPEQQRRWHTDASSRRIGIKAGPPPAIFVQQPRDLVKKDETLADDCKMLRKTVRLRNLASCTDSAEAVAHRLASKFPCHFGTKVVKHSQLENLIIKLQGKAVAVGSPVKGEAGEQYPASAQGRDFADEQERKDEEIGQQDLNRASEAELAAAKTRMDVLFEQNLHKPGSPGYLHDIRKDFDPPEEECDWDKDY